MGVYPVFMAVHSTKVIRAVVAYNSSSRHERQIKSKVRPPQYCGETTALSPHVQSVFAVGSVNVPLSVLSPIVLRHGLKPWYIEREYIHASAMPLAHAYRRAPSVPIILLCLFLL